MATRWQCHTCGTVAAKRAKFCARCGTAIRPSPPPRNIGDDPSPLPRAGWAFLVGLVVGPALAAAGIVWGIKLLLFAGLAIAVTILVLLVLGMFF